MWAAAFFSLALAIWMLTHIGGAGWIVVVLAAFLGCAAWASSRSNFND
jgi:hypothetical protein